MKVTFGKERYRIWTAVVDASAWTTHVWQGERDDKQAKREAADMTENRMETGHDER